MQVNSYIDHTALKATTTKTDIEQLCKEAIENNFATVCVNSTRVALSKKLLDGSSVQVCTVVGFPLGANFKEVKAQEAQLAIDAGAEEIDMVINIQALLDGELVLVKEDIQAVCDTVHKNKKILKVIIETCLLNEQQKRQVCQICKEIKVDYVKTSTGFSTGGATLDDVRLMKEVVQDDVLIKASGGVKNYQDAVNIIEAGASRIGTSSGVKIVNGLESSTTY